jgi:hypothetical protein
MDIASEPVILMVGVRARFITSAQTALHSSLITPQFALSLLELRPAAKENFEESNCQQNC